MAFGNLKFDTLTTSDSKNTNTEKSVDTSYIFNGVAKVWGQGQGDTTTLTDSFNQSAFTDNATGQFIHNFTNNMGNDDYSALSTGVNGDHLLNSVSTTTTSTCRFDHYNQSNSAIDSQLHCMVIFGDVA
tara:strand:- start:302 stop:688 length:387 start_codon:yes stop_codon:yes gene_type:complete